MPLFPKALAVRHANDGFSKSYHVRKYYASVVFTAGNRLGYRRKLIIVGLVSCSFHYLLKLRHWKLSLMEF